MSTTGGYTTTKAKARKPRAFEQRKGYTFAACEQTMGERYIRIYGDEVYHANATRFAAWMQRAAAWCAEGGRR